MKILLTMIAFLFVFNLQGCAARVSHEGATPGIRMNDRNAPNATMRMDSINIIDKSLQDIRKNGHGYIGKIAVEKSGARRSASGTVEVIAVLRNRTDYPLQLEGRVQFFDESGLPLEEPSAWKRVYLSPQSVASYRENSLNTNARHYYVEIREGR